MMSVAKHLEKRRYFLIELAFLIFLSYLSPLISDMEYAYYEEHNFWNFTNSLQNRLVWGTYRFAFDAFFYWGFLKRYVNSKQTVKILLCIAGYIFLYHLYNKYVMSWTILQMDFLSDYIRTRAREDFVREKIYFTINYILVRNIALWLGFAFLIRSLRQDAEVKELKEQQLQLELNYLKNRIQPHFFFNTLNNIYALALERSELTAAMISGLSEMMRYILYRADQARVPLGEEIAFLQHYIGLERMRYGEKADVAFEVQGETGGLQIEPLLLLPFVENAFKHGLEDETGRGYVQVVICITGKELSLQVHNSVPRQEKKPAGGFGLANARKRLGLLYPGRYEWHTGSANAAWQFDLSLSLR